jgi:AcrR family transcriptional regulator
VFVTELQRTRLLDATVAVVSELGYRQMTVRRVSGRAGVSNKTFYDLFENREDCFLATFDEAVDRLAAVVAPAYEGEKEWAGRVRAGLGALLGFLDREPSLSSLVFIEALGAGPRVLARRARVLEDLGSVIDEGRAGVKAGRELPPLTAEGVVGAAFSVIHARLLEHQPGSLTALLNPLMATVVLPYRGHVAAERELERPISKAGPDFVSTEKPAKSGRSRQSLGSRAGPAGRTSGSRAGSRQSFGSRAGSRERPDPARFRPTQRTQMVLAAVVELGGRGFNPSNRQVADAAQVIDQGQISKLLARLEGVGLITNTGGHTQGVPNAWHLTPHGEEILRAGASRDHPSSSPDARSMAQGTIKSTTKETR